ncbi:MAG: hypothetical protein LAT68_08490 [Cyclobacteriaceae bacterium]|nr:hypothetical protein [Cyclobacteriaceae bacterium]MCH8516354.1 hypothetical protein [Cyclobacteriaceae bacterium]
MSQIPSALSSLAEQFKKNVHEFANARDFAKSNYRSKILNTVVLLAEEAENFDLLFSQVKMLSDAGIFEGTPWEKPQSLAPSLVAGTLKSNDDLSVAIEILSELRIASIVKGDTQHPYMDAEEAKDFLKSCMILNLDLLFLAKDEFFREHPERIIRGHNLFLFLQQFIPSQELKLPLLEEIQSISAQRPIVIHRLAAVIKQINNHITLDSENEVDNKIRQYTIAFYGPEEKRFQEYSDLEYVEYLNSLSEDELLKEAELLYKHIKKTGLVAKHYSLLIRHIADSKPQLLDLALDLSPTGTESFGKRKKLVLKIIHETIYPETRQAVYGLQQMLNRGLFNRQPVLSGIEQLLSSRIHPTVEKRILDGFKFSPFYISGHQLSAKSMLLADVISVLGLPLGVGQGLNPTCQTARGISLWSQHAPGKLLNYILGAASQDKLEMRFESHLINSQLLGQGLVSELDLQLDSVSLVLVPHMDRIYNEMMRLGFGRGEDAHKWVNPTLYGQWISTGFANAFNELSQAIVDYPDFIKTFYATHHPDYNGGLNLVYPNPVGIYITTSSGHFLGFHAVSIQRVKKDPSGNVRVYFFNPNNEGRQNWGQGITPSVDGNGEKKGESSILFHEFAARIYAFHFNTNREINKEAIPTDLVKRVEQMARESWGKEYHWL